MGGRFSVFVFVMLLLACGVFASTSNPMFVYHFDSDGTDATGNGYTLTNHTPGTTINAATFKLGTGSANFTGADGGYESTATKNLTLPTRRTVALWVRGDDLATGDVPLFMWGTDNEVTSWQLRINHLTGKPQVVNENGGGNVRIWEANDSTALSPSTWYHIAATQYNNETPMIYINGVGYTTYIAVGPSSNFNVTGTYPIHIGAVGLLAGAMKGQIDEVGFWDKILSNTDINVLYAAGSGAAYPYNAGTTDYPFTVTLNNTDSLTSVQKIVAGFVDDNAAWVYDYGVICDLSESTIWNERFKTGYNFTLNNVTLYSAAALGVTPESLLSYNALLVPVNATDGNLNLIKTGNEGVYDSSKVTLSLSTPNTVNLSVFLYAADGQLTYEIDLRKVGTNVATYRTAYGIDIPLGNFTTVNNGFTLDLYLTPKHDIPGDFNYYGVSIKANNASVGTDDTYDFGGRDIRDAQLYTGSVSNITITQLGYVRTSNLNPEFSQFQNGAVSIFADGTTVTTESTNGASITGDGFVLIPNYNYTFYSKCAYPTSGTYTQRHYMNGVNLPNDYTFYKDLTVTVTEGTSTTGTGAEVSSDAIQGGVNSILDSLGVSSVAGKFVIGFILLLLVVGGSMILSYLMTKSGTIAGFIGVIAFFAGVIGVTLLGLFPFWVLVLLVILCASVVALLFKWVFAADGG